MGGKGSGGKRQGSGAKKNPEPSKMYRKAVPESLYTKVKKEADLLIEGIKDEAKVEQNGNTKKEV